MYDDVYSLFAQAPLQSCVKLELAREGLFRARVGLDIEVDVAPPQVVTHPGAEQIGVRLRAEVAQHFFPYRLSLFVAKSHRGSVSLVRKGSCSL